MASEEGNEPDRASLLEVEIRLFMQPARCAGADEGLRPERPQLARMASS